MSIEDRFTLTDEGWEIYWRERIAQEVKQNFMPVCVCERCGNIREGAMVERILETIKGRT